MSSKSFIELTFWQYIFMIVLVSLTVYITMKLINTSNDAKTETAKTTITLKGYAILSNNRIEVFTKDTVYIIDLQSKKEVNDKIIKGAE